MMDDAPVDAAGTTSRFRGSGTQIHALPCSIPKGLDHLAQGWTRQRTTLGNAEIISSTLEELHNTPAFARFRRDKISF